jgi:hypothetical protein
MVTGCTHSVHQVHTSGFGPFASTKKGKAISARAEQDVIFFYARETNYVDEAYAKIQQKCEGGDIRGLTTQFLTSHGFFHWTNKILIQGRCYKG